MGKKNINLTMEVHRGEDPQKIIDGLKGKIWYGIGNLWHWKYEKPFPEHIVIRGKREIKRQD